MAEPSDAAPATPPDAPSRYQILRRLGGGGMADVWLALDRDLQRPVALKFLKQHDEDDLARFGREATLAAALQHPNIAAIHDFGEHAGRPFLAMAFIEGRTLDEVPRDDPRALVAILRDAARAIHFAHERRVVHRDLKPSNLMLAPDGRVFVMDFGLARLLREPGLTTTGIVVGTPTYMAPEQAQGLAPDERTDVYCLGATLYELVTDRKPFDGATAVEVILKVLHEEPRRPRQINAKVHRDLETIVLKAMDKEPSRRYPSAAALADDLDRFLRSEPIAARPVGPLASTARWSRRNPLAVTAISLAIVAVALPAVLLIELHRARRDALDRMRLAADYALRTALAERRAGDPAAMARALPELEAACAEAARRAPDDPEPPYRLGRVHRALGRDADALALQERALRLDPAYAPSRYERAVLLAKRYRARLAEVDARSAAYDTHWIPAFERLPAPRRRSFPTPHADGELADLSRRIVADIEELRASAGEEDARTLCAEGILLWLGDHWDEARAKLRAAIDRDPAPEEAHEALVEVEIAAGRPDAAIEAADRAASADRGYIAHRLNAARARWVRANQAFDSSEDPAPFFDAALADLEAALRLVPGDPAILRRRANILIGTGSTAGLLGADPLPRYEAARADFDAILALLPRDLDALLARGIVRFNEADARADRGEDPAAVYTPAVADFEALLASSPRSADALLWRGLARLAWGAHIQRIGGDPIALYDAALADLDAAHALLPRADAPLVRRAELWLNRGSFDIAAGCDPDAAWDRALADFEAALALRPDSPPALLGRSHVWLNRAIQREQAGQDASEAFARAVGVLDAALATYADWSDARLRRGYALHHWANAVAAAGGDAGPLYERAVADLEAPTRRPDDRDAALNRASALSDWGGFLAARGQDPARPSERAIAELGALIEADPGDPHLRRDRGVVWLQWAAYRLGAGSGGRIEVERALVDLDEAIRLDGGWAEARIRRAAARFLAGLDDEGAQRDATPSWRDAAADLDAAAAAEPERAEVYWRRGMCRAKLGDWAGACEDFERAARLKPEDAPLFQRDWDAARRRLNEGEY